MKYFLGLLFFFVLKTSLIAQTATAIKIYSISPLAKYAAEWNMPIYAECNTAANEKYLQPKEKEIIYILNLVRVYPKLFANTVLTKYPKMSDKLELLNDTYYFKSLLETLRKLEAKPLLFADKKCYTSAFCHAKSSGKRGYTGHDRLTNECEKKSYFNGECCDYGNDDPLDIVLSLLIDTNVPSLGHRNILLSSYEKIGVSFQPHKKYEFSAVIDLHY